MTSCNRILLAAGAVLALAATGQAQAATKRPACSATMTENCTQPRAAHTSTHHLKPAHNMAQKKG